VLASKSKNKDRCKIFCILFVE